MNEQLEKSLLHVIRFDTTDSLNRVWCWFENQTVSALLAPVFVVKNKDSWWLRTFFLYKAVKLELRL